jgi:hypothetical protein
MAFVGPRSRVRRGAGIIRRADGPLPDVLFSGVSSSYRALADRQHDAPTPFSREGLHLFHPPCVGPYIHIDLMFSDQSGVVLHKLALLNPFYGYRLGWLRLAKA